MNLIGILKVPEWRIPSVSYHTWLVIGRLWVRNCFLEIKLFFSLNAEYRLVSGSQSSVINIKKTRYFSFVSGHVLVLTAICKLMVEILHLSSDDCLRTVRTTRQLHCTHRTNTVTILITTRPFWQACVLSSSVSMQKLSYTIIVSDKYTGIRLKIYIQWDGTYYSDKPVNEIVWWFFLKLLDMLHKGTRFVFYHLVIVASKCKCI